MVLKAFGQRAGHPDRPEDPPRQSSHHTPCDDQQKARDSHFSNAANSKRIVLPPATAASFLLARPNRGDRIMLTPDLKSHTSLRRTASAWVVFRTRTGFCSVLTACATIMLAVAGTPAVKAAEQAPALVLHVSPSGNDAWSGRSAAPNADQTDGPLATLGRAQERIRELKAAPGGQPGPITVLLRGGTYPLSKPLVFTAEIGRAHV